MKKTILFSGIIVSLFFGCKGDIRVLKEKANLTFEKLTINGKTTISKEALFAQIKEDAKKGFKMKILRSSDSSIAEVQGSKPNFSILIKKAGTFKLTLVLEKSGFLDVVFKTEVTINQKAATFEKLIVKGKKIITKQEFLKQIRGLSGLGFTLKSIVIPAEQSEFAELKNDFSILIKKAGAFKITVVLEKDGFLDVLLKGEILVNQKAATFEKLIVKGKKIITKQEFLKQIRGLSGLGFTLKSIVIPAEQSEFAELKNDFSILIKKAGAFKITVVLEKDGFLDVLLKGEILVNQKAATFEKLIVKGKKVITKQEFLKQIRGLTNLDYTIKNIEIAPEKSTFAKVQGSKSNFSILIKKVGNFTAKIILEKQPLPDITLEDCEFEITSQYVIFQKLSLTNGKSFFNKREISKQIKGPKTGYKMKSIEIPANKANIAEVQGAKPNFSILMKREGNFVAKIILEKQPLPDITLEYCEFDIQNKTFTFPKLKSSDKIFNSNKILAQIKGPKTGYTIKSIEIPANKANIAEVQGAKPNFSILMKREGNFVAKIVLERRGFLDVAIENCEFQIDKPHFDFQTLITNNGNSYIWKNQILEKIKNGQTTGYTLKNVVIEASGVSFGKVYGTKPDFYIKVKKYGNFVAKIVLERRGFLDVEIENCEFQIDKPPITFEKYTNLEGLKLIPDIDILRKIRGPKSGYKLKSITLKDASYGNTIGSKPHISIMAKKGGNFKADIVLEKNTHLDVTIENCEFEILPKVFTFRKLKNNRGYKYLFEDYILSAIENSDNCKIKMMALPPRFAEVKLTPGGALRVELKKVGTFTGTVVLERYGFLDATIQNCEFEASAETMTFPKYPGTTEIQIFHKDKILKHIKNSAHYTIKSIVIPSDKSEFAEVRGSKPDFSIKIKKEGKFTADMVLERDINFFDVKLDNCEFDLRKAFVVTYGSPEADWANSVVQTSDGGLAVTGYTTKNGNPDLWILTLNDKGKLVTGTHFSKEYGLDNPDNGSSIIQMSDGNLAVAGYTQSWGWGKKDVWLMQINKSNGNFIRGDTYGGSRDDAAMGIVQTTDGDFVVAGYTQKGSTANHKDFYLFKVDENFGSSIWSKEIDGNGTHIDEANALIQTTDGSLLMAGTKYRVNGRPLAWVSKHRSDNGNLIWSKDYYDEDVYGNKNFDEGRGIVETSDGHYAVCGWGTRFWGANPLYYAWILKINKNTGAKIWKKIYKGTQSLFLRSIIETSDGNLVAAGKTKNKGEGEGDFWIIKVNKDNGNIIWEKTHGGGWDDEARSLVEMSNSNLAVVGYTDDGKQKDCRVIILTKEGKTLLKDK